MKIRILLAVAWLAGMAISPLAAADEAFRALDTREAAALGDPARHTAPTIVALWSAECVHCKKNLALFATLAGRYPKLRLITVAVDPVEEALAAPLERAGVRGVRYAYGAESPEALAYALDPRWRGELPRTLLFDGRGGRVAASGVMEEEAVRRGLGLGQ